MTKTNKVLVVATVAMILVVGLSISKPTKSAGAERTPQNFMAQEMIQKNYMAALPDRIKGANDLGTAKRSADTDRGPRDIKSAALPKRRSATIEHNGKNYMAALPKRRSADSIQPVMLRSADLANPMEIKRSASTKELKYNDDERSAALPKRRSADNWVPQPQRSAGTAVGGSIEIKGADAANPMEIKRSAGKRDDAGERSAALPKRRSASSKELKYMANIRPLNDRSAALPKRRSADTWVPQPQRSAMALVDRSAAWTNPDNRT